MDAPEVAVARVTDTELLKLPPLGVIVGVATVETAVGSDVFENHALASELGLALFLNAFTFKSALVEIVIGPEYFFEDSSGDKPFVV